MRNTILGQSHLKLGDTYYYPLESTVHISHIAQHAVAGERHAFSLEEGRSQETEDRMRGAELSCNLTQKQRKHPSFRADLDRREREVENSHRAKAVISSAAERSREILSCRSIAKREKISHRLHRFSQKFQSDDGLCSQASGLHGTAKRSCHAETAETAETPVISSAAERSREILLRRSIAKRDN